MTSRVIDFARKRVVNSRIKREWWNQKKGGRGTAFDTVYLICSLNQILHQNETRKDHVFSFRILLEPCFPLNEHLMSLVVVISYREL